MSINKLYSIVININISTVNTIFKNSLYAFSAIFVVDSNNNNIISFIDDNNFEYKLNTMDNSYFINNTMFYINLDKLTQPELNNNYYLNSNISMMYFKIGSNYYDNYITINESIILNKGFTFTIKQIKNVLCFLENTKILCLKNNIEEYVPIQDLQINDLIKTYKHEYLPIELINSFKLYNNYKNNIKDQLYVFKKNKYDLTEDLILTGSHNILVDELIANTRLIIKNIYKIEDKYRLPTFMEINTEQYTEGVFTLWHLVLKNKKFVNNQNYGIYANGLLVESCIKKSFINFFRNRYNSININIK
jgi:hypothetical protein